MTSTFAPRARAPSRFDRTLTVSPTELIEIRSALYAESARIEEQARNLPHRLKHRRMIEENHADRLRQLAERFECD